MNYVTFSCKFMTDVVDIKFISLNDSCFSLLAFTGSINERIVSMKRLEKWCTQAAASKAKYLIYALTKQRNC